MKEKISELIKNNPVRVFGLVYPYLLVIGILIGLYYISNLDQLARQKVPVVLPDTTKVEDLPIVAGKIIPAINVTEISQVSQTLIDKGRSLYSTNCSSCHGENGAGTGPASVGLNPAPRNFTKLEGWKNGAKLTQIYQTLQEGIQGSGMIAYEFLAPEEKFALAHYVRTFVPDPPMDTPDELTAIDQMYNLSAGQEVPSQIPVSVSEQIIAKEYESAFIKLTNIRNKILAERNNEGAKIFEKISINKIKTLSLLNNSSDTWKRSKDKLVNVLVSNFDNKVLSSSLFSLSDNDWNVLFNYLSSLF
ncbi:MAG: cytochrome c [Ignavibacteriaceae bacterium]|nr:cytochrome c [Ignavibacteriaceae bacterium]